MTNREWLKSLSNEELAKYLQWYIDCEQCPVVNCDGEHCFRRVLKWLQTER